MTLPNILMRDKYDKKYMILKATSQNLYIDEMILNLSPQTLSKLIDELIQEGLLRLNGYDDNNGLNKYDTTSDADEIVSNRKEKAVNLLVNRAACAVGTMLAAYNNHSI